MSRFTEGRCDLSQVSFADGRPVLRGDRVQWALDRALTWEVGAEGSGVVITAPAWNFSDCTGLELKCWREWRNSPQHPALKAAFATDLGSIPPFLRGLPGFSPDGAGVKAFVIHDVLYCTQGLGGVYTRKEADAILREALVALGVPKWRASVIHSAVRLGGASGWGR